ncbi:MAG: lysostaphin resistance A-like protein [Planctomycetota bacterium]
MNRDPALEDPAAGTSNESIELLRAWIEAPGAWTVLVLGSVVVTALAGVGLWAILTWGSRERPGSLPAPRWNGSDVALVFCFWLGLQFLAGSAASLWPLVWGEDGGPIAELVRYALLMMVNLFTSVVILMLPALRYRQGLEVYGLEARRAGPGLLLGLLSYAATIPALFVLMLVWVATLVSLNHAAEPQPAIAVFARLLEARDIVGLALFVLLTVVGAPILEECLFRGLLFRWLDHRLGAGLAMVISGLLFGAIHVHAIAVVPTAVLGMLLAFLYHRTNNLWLCVGFHALFNGGQLAIMVQSAS